MAQTEKRLPTIVEIERLVEEQIETLKGPPSPVEAVEYGQRTKRIGEMVKGAISQDSSEPDD